MVDLCFALQARKTANFLARVHNAALEPLGLEISQSSTLCAIALEQSDSITELGGAPGVERSTLTRNLKLLERDDLPVGARGTKVAISPDIQGASHAFRGPTASGRRPGTDLHGSVEFCRPRTVAFEPTWACCTALHERPHLA
jgi:hypothetical protein